MGYCGSVWSKVTAAYPECKCGQLKIVGLWMGKDTPMCPFCFTTPRREPFAADQRLKAATAA